MARPGMLTPHYMQIITATYVHTYLKEGHSHIITAQYTSPLAAKAVNSQANSQVLTTITYVRTNSVCARTHKQLQINTSFQNSCD